jgi:very-short-patch-repair endonuclease
MPHPKRSTPKIMRRAIELRKDPTPAERKLWSRIRNNQLEVNFRRQHAIGNFIPDFVCIEKKLIVELDGSQHLEQEEYDRERTAYFESKGYRVIRFWNNDVTNNLEAVLKVIWDTLKEQKQIGQGLMKREIKSMNRAIDRFVSPTGTSYELPPEGDDIPQGDDVWVE